MMQARAVVGIVGALMLAACTSEGPPPSAQENYAPHEPQKAYLYYCGGCHAAPQSGSRVASEWPAIVSRMQQRRIATRIGPIPPEQLRMILDYLQHNAADARDPA
jgi:hypothetical protein